MTDQRFPKTARLRTKIEFDRVYQGNTFVADNVLVIRGQTNQLDTTRLGLSISRKVGNAVVRNRWKRVIRDAFRRQRQSLPKGIDLVVRPKKGAVCDHAAVCRSIERLTMRLQKKLTKSNPTGEPKR